VPIPDHVWVGLLRLSQLACAVGCVAFFLRGMLATWRAARHAEEVLQRVEVLTGDGRAAEVMQVLQTLPGSTAAAIAAALADPAAVGANAERTVDGTIQSERSRLSAHVRALDLVGALALMVPIAATAWALLDDRYDAGAGAEALSWEPILVAAVAGLSIAIAATLGRFWILARVRRIVVDMEKGVAVVYNTAR
jgi:hypothetical protein